jgi:XRE family transcriptional regulator, regulator of sulfur utilization
MSTAASIRIHEPTGAVGPGWAPPAQAQGVAAGLDLARPLINDALVFQLVGRNLKHLRKQHRFSLEELSSQCGVSRAMLGQIEQGKSIPSIKTLWQIAQAMGVSVAWFLEASHEAKVLRMPVPDDSRGALGYGQGELRLLQHMSDGGIDAFYELRLAPSAQVSLPAPPVAHRVHVTVAQGVLTAWVDDGAHVVGPREALQYEGHRQLSWRNDGALPVLGYVVIRARPWKSF